MLGWQSVMNCERKALVFLLISRSTGQIRISKTFAILGTTVCLVSNGFSRFWNMYIFQLYLFHCTCWMLRVCCSSWYMQTGARQTEGDSSISPVIVLNNIHTLSNLEYFLTSKITGNMSHIIADKSNKTRVTDLSYAHLLRSKTIFTRGISMTTWE